MIPLIPDEVMRTILDLFEMNTWSAGFHRRPENTLAASGWIASISTVYRPFVYMATVHKIQHIAHDARPLGAFSYRHLSHHGLILATTPSHPLKQSVGTNPFRIVELEWPDPVTRALQSYRVMTQKIGLLEPPD